MSLGLTRNAAKIFITLCQIGAAAATTISRGSGVAREVVYQKMPSLVKKGLVEEILASPKLFKAIPVKEAYNLLLQQKKQENIEIVQKVEAALKKKPDYLQVKNAYQFRSSIISSGGQHQHFKIHQEFEKVQKSLDVTLPVGKFLQWSQHYAELDLQRLQKRSIKTRIITEKRILKWMSDAPETFSSVISKFNYINVRCVQKSPTVQLMIFDKKTLFLSIKKEPNINKMQWLFSNNPFLLEMANSYFETQWENATELSEDYSVNTRLERFKRYEHRKRHSNPRNS